MSTSTRPASVSWERLDAPPAERTLLQRVTPVHMGVVMILVLVFAVMASGPTAMRTPGTNRLPALPGSVSGGGSGDPLAPPRAGATAVNAAATANSTTSAVTPAAVPAKSAPNVTKVGTPRAMAGAGMLRIGSARLNPRILHGGIISPAAGTQLLVSGGGTAPSNTTEHVRMTGIPSPAAGSKLAPQALPYRPSDGVTLPRTDGQRDSHATESHYAGTLPMEQPVERPAMTPGQAAEDAEQRTSEADLASTTGSKPRPDGPISAY